MNYKFITTGSKGRQGRSYKEIFVYSLIAKLVIYIFEVFFLVNKDKFYLKKEQGLTYFDLIVNTFYSLI